MSNSSLVLTVFRKFFTWIALGDLDVCSSLMLVKKANNAEEETTQVTCLYHECNQSTQVTDSVTVVSLSASSLRKCGHR
jgi:hypothetical protein